MERISKLIPLTGQTAVRLSGIVLLASLLISGVSVYVTLAAPLHAPFVPSSVAFQGQLLGSDGVPVANGAHPLTFKLYSQESGGTELWAETQSVQVTEGIYNIQLGLSPTLPPNAFDGPRWLGVTVGTSTDPEMAPRVPISAVPFALNAHSAQGLQGYPISTATPTSGQVLTFNAAANNWGPAAASASVPSIRVYNTAPISTGTKNTWKVLTFNTNRWNMGLTHSTASGSNTYLALSSASQAGKYLIFGSVEFAWNTNVGQRYIEILWTPSGGPATVIAHEMRDAVTDPQHGPTRMTISTEYSIANGDHVELRVMQSAANGVAVQSTGNYSPEFGMVRIGD